MTAQLVTNQATNLSTSFADRRTLREQQTMRPRPERGAMRVSALMGQAVGRLYVQKFFPPEAKARMKHMVANLLEAYRQSINSVEWMTPETGKRPWPNWRP